MRYIIYSQWKDDHVTGGDGRVYADCARHVRVEHSVRHFAVLCKNNRRDYRTESGLGPHITRHTL